MQYYNLVLPRSSFSIQKSLAEESAAEGGQLILILIQPSVRGRGLTWSAGRGAQCHQGIITDRWMRKCCRRRDGHGIEFPEVPPRDRKIETPPEAGYICMYTVQPCTWSSLLYFAPPSVTLCSRRASAAAPRLYPLTVWLLP